ncbi:MAG: MFS transporter [Acidobacteria bacterium]|nr:MAG: MFS transporter [Acidobacteriota bacterium]PYY10100.1 MAG: MFS transporter [Acidobacteriota bacterium]
MPGVASEPVVKDSRNLYAFGATSFFNDTASEMAYWVLPAFLASIGADPEKLGFIEGIAESVASFAKLFSGYLADRLARRKPIVVSGYVVANAVKPVLAFATSWWHVLVIRFSDRLAKGVRGAPRDVMLAESAEKTKVGAAFGLLQAMDSAGAIAGPLLALGILAHYSMRGVFWAAVVPGGLSILVATFGIRERQHRPRTGSRELGTLSWHAHLPASFYYVLFAVTLFSLGNSSDMFLVLRAQNLGIPASHAPLLGLVFNITYTLLSWPAGHFSDRFSRRTIVAVGYTAFAAVYFVFARGPSTLAIWITMASYGLFYALTNPVLRALVAGTVSPEVRGRAFGIYYFVISVATLLASLITGELWKHYGAQIPFYFSAALAVVSAVLLLASKRLKVSS